MGSGKFNAVTLWWTSIPPRGSQNTPTHFTLRKPVYTCKQSSGGLLGLNVNFDILSYSLGHRQPRLTIRVNGTWLSLCGLQEGVVLQRSEFYKGLYGRKQFRNYLWIYLHFEHIIKLPQCLVIFSVVISFHKPIRSILGEVWHVLVSSTSSS